ncbi:D-alanyl-D-alanine carboxypeptidase family protein [Alkalilimnicola sp. S0819]|uniref:D-alanyl-D-alanine carboxypeptidase family protein n=1 Tax=Alkalilimnicola sp. S0819 TaxID=2613922 RepID=UPI0012626694|nr:D-alanyl-D-alanine carboxypeptidase family protein [Alkalilimnicola sp. S0819]KAB7623766.1 D-alanyl-D-alanine carboxypeptidase [Alkalilimnicola sp. S0819]MPQ16638.1 serine-type D-Ala-D-Ala carboxypeptidase [Alkalilimnicola sp. S0819]
MSRTLFRTAALLFSLLAAAPALSQQAPPASIPVPAPPQLAAPSYLLLDFHSGHVLAEKAPDERRDPASLTKMMTAYVAFSELRAGNMRLDEMVTVSEKAWRAPGSRMFIEVGKQVSVEDLLRGIIIQSGNDASIAIAEHIAGSESTFAQVMNTYAQRLGMNNSNFLNATGLPNPNHYVSTRDVALLAAALIRDFPEYYQWYSQKQFSFNGITQYNRNKLLWRDPSVDGLKTGHTNAAGYCLASSAQQDDMRLVAVVMGTASEKARADDSQALLNYGFRFFETHRLYGASEALSQARVWKGAREQLPLGLEQDLYVTIPRRQYDRLDASMSMESQIMAPVDAGSTLGKLVVRLGDTVLAERPLVALDPVKEGGLWQRLSDEVLLMFE